MYVDWSEGWHPTGTECVFIMWTGSTGVFMCVLWWNCFCAENKRMHQELRRAAADVARLQKKARKGEQALSRVHTADFWRSQAKIALRAILALARV